MLEITSLNDLSVYLDRLIKGHLWLKVIIGLILGAMSDSYLTNKNHSIRSLLES